MKAAIVRTRTSLLWTPRSSLALATTRQFMYRYCMPEINSKAPDFTLPDENGNPVSLDQFRGKNVVLFFYPKANTPG